MDAYGELPSDVASLVVHEGYLRYRDSTLVLCFLTLKNGQVIVGQSACGPAVTFDEGFGRALAREKAVAEVRRLEGYVLSSVVVSGAVKYQLHS